MSFQIGDKVAHPMYGAGVVESVVQKKVDGVVREYYTLKLPRRAMVVLIPTDSCEEIGVRPVVDAPQADRVLAAMNRGYTREHYLGLVRSLRQRIPDIVLTSDIIVGFPGETTAEFEDTLTVLREVEFDALFTFLYSPREGTPAARLPDPLSKEEKAANFQRLVDLQNEISAKKQQGYVGRTLRCLVDVVSEDPRHNLNARTAGGRLVHFSGDPALLGSYVRLKITGASTWALFGEPAD